MKVQQKLDHAVTLLREVESIVKKSPTERITNYPQALMSFDELITEIATVKLSDISMITHEPNDKDTWICICGNRPDSHGFYPCDANGIEMEPLQGSSWDGLYVCGKCGRIINMDSLEVVGERKQ